jgi:hypothetical protein
MLNLSLEGGVAILRDLKHTCVCPSITLGMGMR